LCLSRICLVNKNLELLAKIIKGVSPFDDGGTVEVLEGFPEGADIPMFQEAPEEFSPGLDSGLKKLAQQVQVTG
jgi:manganese catalase